MFVSKSGDGTERPSSPSLSQTSLESCSPLLCSTPRAGLPARTSNLSSTKVRERESISEVEAPKDNETCDDVIDDSTGMESSCLGDEFNEFQ